MQANLSLLQAEQIFREHADSLYRFVLFLTHSRELADDITQETLLMAFRKYHTFDSNKSIRPWLHKIALNLTRNTLRRQRWLQFCGELPETVGMDSVETTVLRSETDRELWCAINGLGLKNREILVLHFYCEMTLKEVAILLGIPLGTCKSRLNKALTLLRQQLGHNDSFYQNQGEAVYDTIGNRN